MGCKFCASTIGGRIRDLTAAELLGQVIAAQKDMGERISNIVMMGIGEPLDNYDNVLKFLRLVNCEEGLCIALYEEPEMIEDMLATMADTAVKIIERVGDKVGIDNLTIHEDMAGKSGPLIGPNHITEFLKPYYTRVWEAAKAHGATLFSQDSDGDMTPVIDAFLDCGVNCFYPFEPAAGMDMVKMREKYGHAFYVKGGIDKHALRKDKEAIRAELEYKTSDIMRGGGTIFALDHRIPNGVSIENYRYYVALGREMLGLPPISGEGWERMAF